MTDDSGGATRTKMALSCEILLFGHDVMLERTRAAILGMDGFQVDLVTTLCELASCLAARHYRFLLLCHSLPAAERDTAIALAASFLPVVPLLAIQKYTEAAFDDPSGLVLHVRSGPELRFAARALVPSTAVSTSLEKRKIAKAQFEGTVSS